jgi:hypothetical protein
MELIQWKESDYQVWRIHVQKTILNGLVEMNDLDHLAILNGYL